MCICFHEILAGKYLHLVTCLQGMKTSAYFEQALFYEQSPATDQFFEIRSSQLFEALEGCSFVDVYVQSPPYDDQTSNGKRPGDFLRKNDAKSLIKLSSVPPSPVDYHRYCKEGPPRYVEASGLRLQRVSDPEGLSSLASVSILR